ncbi:MAG TPA: ribonuclease HII [Gemmatimonadota bacterium]|nr:ribonuclease HII [Gemmatimonadota bacterium]
MSGLDDRLSHLSVSEIHEVLTRRQVVGRRTVEHLLRDPRAGVRALGQRYLDRVRAIERERARVRRLLATERELLEAEGRSRATPVAVVAGVDEVGMAPLAGPVVAAAVVLPEGWIVPALDDSKRVEPALRVLLDREIRAVALAVGVGVVSERVIDRINIYQAGLLAMRLALSRLAVPFDLALLDGRPPRTFPVPHRAVVGGDARVRSIAAASIVAKVARDRLLADCHRRWPEYGFDTNKGYPTAQHMEALRAHGMCPIHRLSFPRVWEEADAMGPLYRDLCDRLAAADSPASLESAEFAFDAARASLHASEEKLLQRLLESRREALAELQGTL